MPIEFDLSENAPQHPRRILLYGEFGTGKSYSLRTIPEPHRGVYILDLDKGTSGISGVGKAGDFRGFHPDKMGMVGRKEAPVAYEQCKDKLQALHKSGDNAIRTIVIDSFTELYASILDWVLYSNNKALDSPPSQPDYGIALRLAIKFVEALCEMRKNIIVICHESTHQNDVTGVVKITPAMTGQLAVRLPGYFDEVLHCGVKGRGDKAEYIWETRPTGLAVARTRNPSLSPVIPQDFAGLLPERFFYDDAEA